MITRIHISPSVFAQAFLRFQAQVEQAEESSGAFRDFQSGLAYSMEHYKEWLYLEARRRLSVETWMEKQVGTGAILKRVIQAIEIHEDKDHRNNIVEWQGRKGPGSKSTLKLLKAQDDSRERPRVEKALWQMYAMQADSKTCFEQLVALLGPRYDLISYLFFIRDWNQFMPVKSSFFPEVFDLLGVPHPMVKRCNWENYSGVMARLREVQRHLQGYNIPNGVRLLDAHSFCWMLGCLDEPPAETAKDTGFLPMRPEAGALPIRGQSEHGTTQEQLEEIQRAQRRIGDLAQAIVLEAERKRLAAHGRSDLAGRVRDVSHEVSLGYDIESFTLEGQRKPIEVKAAAKRGNDCRFFLSENEKRHAHDLPNYHFVLVFDVESKKPVLHEFAGCDLPGDALHPIQYEVRLKHPQK
ncbi:MAG: DUF3883 domain-containing protein [Verrucomicrobiaceae bacterium]